MDISSWWCPALIVVICVCPFIGFCIGVSGERNLSEDVKHSFTWPGLVLSLIFLGVEAISFGYQASPEICTLFGIGLGASLFALFLGAGLFVGPVTRR